MRSRHTGGADRTALRLGTLTWAALAAAATLAAVPLAAPVGELPSGALVPVIVAVFGLTLARIAASARARPARRAPLGALALGVTLLFLGSATLNVAGLPHDLRFPASGEWFFVAAYAALAGSILLGVRRRHQPSLSSWLEAAVACGGAGCLAGLLLLAPWSQDVAGGGVPVLVAFLYPLLDAVLLTLVLGQVVLRHRPADGYALALVLGWLCIGWSDTVLVRSLGSGVYEFSALDDAAWMVGIQLVVSGSLRLRERREATPRGSDDPGPPRLLTVGVLLLPQVLAVSVLVFQPTGRARWYVVAPAVATLVAAGARTVLALRAARGAAEAVRLSMTDELTGLPNRRAFISHVDEHLPGRTDLGLVLLDLDGFKEVNDSLGHAAGDAMLRVLGGRLREALPPGAHLSRLGGDEFAVALADRSVERLMALAEQIREVVHRPVSIDDIEVRVSAAVGVSVAETDDRSHDDLLRRADVAMYQSKSARSGAALYDPARDDSSRYRLGLAEDLRRGLGRGELVVHYQPQVAVGSRAVCGVEALVRWQHPRDGLVSPGVFLPVARRAGLMTLVSEVVVEHVVADLSRWCRTGLDVSVAINLAPPELLSGPVLARLFARLEEVRLDPSLIVVEVTEDSFLADPERAREVLLDVRERGVQMSIDDYGTGFSSLAYLRDLPVQELKIDRSFVSGVTTDDRSRLIVGATVQLARGLGMRTVAEGVEDEPTALALADLGIDVLQGFHLARPMPAADLDAWLAARPRERV